MLVVISMAASPNEASAVPSIDGLCESVVDVLSSSAAAYHFEPGDASPSRNVEPSVEPSITLNDLDASAQSRPENRPFGLADTRSWLINGGVASDFNDVTIGRSGLGVSYFVADDVSFDAELNHLYFDQELNDALGINLNLLIRWHAWHNKARTWSAYFDAGVGIMVSDEDVPDLGARFNFTPQIGGGMSFRVGNDSRLYVGTRWHHTSNANIFEQNPGRDTVLVYAMIGFPF